MGCPAFCGRWYGAVFGLGEKGLVIDDSTYAVDPIQATAADFAIISTPDSGPRSVPTPVQITTQTYTAQPDVWFGNQRALAEILACRAGLGYGPAWSVVRSCEY